MRILVAEQDVHIARGISLALKSAGFSTDHIDRCDEALEMARQFDYDLVLLDGALRGLSGITVLQQMRNARKNTPVVILAANPSAQFKTAALRAGADDVIAVPMDPEELVARMHAIARSSKGLGNSPIRIGGLVVDLGGQEATCHGTPIKLTGKEFAVLHLLALRRGTVLSRDAFLDHLYGGMDEPEAKIIDVFVCKLRRKLQLAGISDLIINVWGRGYMLRESQSQLDQVPMIQRPAPLRNKAPRFTP